MASKEVAVEGEGYREIIEGLFGEASSGSMPRPNTIFVTRIT